MSLRFRPLLGLFALAAPGVALAQTAAPLTEVIVTSTRLPAPIVDVSGAKVIDRAEIERRNAFTAADVLATVPGATLSRNGAFGGLTSLRLRGAPSDKSLVLIDGVPVGDPSQPAGGYDFAGLDLGDVERIEILSGPQGSLWGSDAIGGVVDIVTREPGRPQASATYGSYDSWRASGSVGTSSAHGAFGVSGSVFTTDGISKADARDGNTETDPFRNYTLSANARLNPSSALKLEARVRYNRAKADFDSFAFNKTGVADGPDTSDVESLSGFARATVSGGPLGFTHALSVDASTTDRAYGGAFPFTAKGGRTDFRWLAQQDPARPVALAVGVEHESAHEDTGSGRQTAENTAAFAIARWSPVSKVSLSASLRRDDPQRYKGRTTARISGRTDLGGGFALAASWGQGFKTPSLYQQTYPCFECTRPGPNPALRAETADGYDATLSWHGDRGEAQVTAYHLNLHDRIDYRFPTGYLNIANARSSGIEAQGQLALGAGFSLRGSYALTDATDSLTGDQLGVPRHSGTLGLDWTGAKLQLAVLARAQTGAPASRGRLKGFTTIEASGAYALSQKVRLTLRVENLTDRHYQQAFGYGEPGLSAYGGVSVRY